MKCPKCGEELPLLSKVCPVCKTVVDKQDGAPDAMELTQALDAQVLTIKKLVPAMSGLRLSSYVWLYILLLAVFLGAVAAKAGIPLLWILAAAGLLTALLVFRNHKKKDNASAQLSEARVSYEYGITLVKRYFKGNAEMSRFVDETNRVYQQSEYEISKGRSRSLLVGLGIAVVEAILFGAILFAVPGRDKATEQVPKDFEAKVGYFIKAGEPEKAVTAYAESEFNDDFLGADKRVFLAESLCQAGYSTQAEEFVLKYAAGKMRDADCAMAVVRTYLADGDKASAAAFVSKCTGLRYKSDVKKIQELIK